jgi:DNA-binding NtrC family response regulator
MNSTLLLVDDDAIQAVTRKAILERTGCQVILASDGEAALEILSNSEFTSTHALRLIVTDHLMPGMNGPQLVQEVRSRGFNIPILVLSGLPDAETEYEEMDVEFRLKPFAPDSLIALVRELLCNRMPRSA